MERLDSVLQPRWTEQCSPGRHWGEGRTVAVACSGAAGASLRDPPVGLRRRGGSSLFRHLFAVLLLAFVAGVAATPVHAQTMLVSTSSATPGTSGIVMAQRVSLTPAVHLRRKITQGFRTGGSRYGYMLSSIELRFGYSGNGSPSPPTVELQSTTGVVLKTFTKPSLHSAGGNRFHEYTLDSSVWLAPNTEYLVVAKDASTAWPVFRWYSRLTQTLDSGFAEGWSLSDPISQRTDIEEDPVPVTGRMMLRINGTVLPNTPATGKPLISGEARVGAQLTASLATVDDANGISPLSHLNYQWIRVDGTTETDISGAQFLGYTPTGADVGKQVKFRVSFTDDWGYAESRTSDAWPAGGSIRAAGGTSHCTSSDPNELWCGTVTAGSLENVTGYSSSVGSISNAWFDFGSWEYNIRALYVDSNTNKLHLDLRRIQRPTIISPEVFDGRIFNGLRLHVGTNSVRLGDASRLFSDFAWSSTRGISISASDVLRVRLVRNAAATGKPSISGAARVGATLTALRGTIDDANGLPPGVSGYSYQWIRVDGETETEIEGATRSSYAPGTADQGKRVRVRVSFTDVAGFPESRTSDAWPAAGSIGAAESTSGGGLHCTSSDPNELWCGTVTAGSLENVTGYNSSVGSISNAWFDFGSWEYNIRALYVDSNTNKLHLDLRRIQRPTIISPEVFDGRIFNGLRLHVGTNSVRLGDASRLFSDFAWSSTRGISISASDVLRVRLVRNAAATGKPSISGAARVGATLTALRGTIDDANGLPPGTSGYSYQWIRVDGETETEIEGATRSSYAPGTADQGKRVRVRVSFTDVAGFPESRTSDAWPATGTIAAADPLSVAHCNPSDPEEIWCSSLTVGSAGQFRGYNAAGSYGALLPDSFAYRGATIAVTRLDNTADSDEFAFTITRRAGSTPSDGLLGAGRFLLHVGTGAARSAMVLDYPGRRTSFRNRRSVPSLRGAMGGSVPVRMLLRSAPAVASIERHAPASSPTNANALTWRVTFSEAVTNVDTADFAVSGTTGTVTAVTAVTGSTSQFDVTASGGDLADLDAEVTLSFAAAQDIVDTTDYRLSSTMPTGTDESAYVVDNTAPTVVSIERHAPASSPTSVDSLTWRVTFSEAVSNVNAADFAVTGTTGTVTAAAAVADTNAYNVTASGGDLADLDATVTVSFATEQDIADAAGNALSETAPTVTNDNDYEVNNSGPAVASIERARAGILADEREQPRVAGDVLRDGDERGHGGLRGDRDDGHGHGRHRGDGLGDTA